MRLSITECNTVPSSETMIWRSRLEMAGRGSLQTVDRALDVLEQIGDAADGITLTEISVKVGLSKATVSRMVASLAKRGYVRRDPTNLRYRLGVGILNLTGEFLQSIEFREVAVSHLREIQRLSGETANLAIMDAGEVVYLERIESPHTVKASFRVGKRAPLSCTALGKAILAFTDEDEVRRHFAGGRNLVRSTERSLSSLQALLEELARVRVEGVAVDDEEHQIGVRCVGGPIFDVTGRVIAAISVSGPTSRISRERLPELCDLVRRASQAISAELGCPVSPARYSGC
jgi:IclR family acetate operon transcriptional repressor